MSQLLPVRLEQPWVARLRWLSSSRASGSRSRWTFALPTALFVAITMFVCADMVDDVASGISTVHLLIECGAVLLCLAGVAATGIELAREVDRSRALARDLESTRSDLARSQAEAVALRRDLSAAMDKQFQEWELSPAECEVALLILKGLSYKEIAQLRTTSERTIRHQAISIFHKAGLSSRAEMAAYFLEDLLLPPTPAQATRSSTFPDPLRGVVLVPPASRPN